ncbi:hypothetical protein FIBSPDRAFT_954100 [Athelia psychrophila]|uniref:Uncharacterized protein n=1 Tax=Athelia psychrophila TaxID=1759441 RepID=A0A166JIQ4_9AGAM|nr:hypothetical protein FIBSPDRAFT_954100 [Fibularhizoctonia sp. CBS 109695]
MRMTTRKITNKGQRRPRPFPSSKSWILAKNRVDFGTNLTFGIERGFIYETTGPVSNLSPPELHELRDALHPSALRRHFRERPARKRSPLIRERRSAAP